MFGEPGPQLSKKQTVMANALLQAMVEVAAEHNATYTDTLTVLSVLQAEVHNRAQKMVSESPFVGDKQPSIIVPQARVNGSLRVTRGEQ